MDDYRVSLWNKYGKCCFSKPGRFKDDEDALDHIFGIEFHRHVVAGNIAFAISGGLTRSYYWPPSFEKIELINISKKETTFYKPENQ